MKPKIYWLMKKAEQLAIEERLRSCGKKLKHESFEVAEQSRARSEAKFGWAMNSYECPFCGKWHIGRAKKP